jgi:hypothetical protein
MQSLDLGDCRLRNPRSREIEREREICWDVRVKKVDDTSSSTHACMHARWYLQDDCVGLFFFFFFFFLFPFFFFSDERLFSQFIMGKLHRWSLWYSIIIFYSWWLKKLLGDPCGKQ